MSDTTHIEKTLEDLRRQLMFRMADVAKLLGAINVLEDMHELPRTTLPTIQLDAPVASPVAGSSRPQIKADDYLGEEPLEAAKKYIQSVGHAVHIDDIGEAISKGGAAIKGADWK